MDETTPIDWITKAIERQAIPKHMREGTVEEFCTKYGTNPKSFYYELSKEDNKKRILEVALNIAKESVPEIMEKLVELAKNGDMRAIDTYLDSVVKLAKNLEIKTDDKSNTEYIVKAKLAIDKFLNGNTNDTTKQ